MYMIAGPNGAAKPTLYETRIKPVLRGVPFINADVIQRDEIKDPSMQAAYKAAQIAEQRRQAYLAEGRSFVSESDLLTRIKAHLDSRGKKGRISRGPLPRQCALGRHVG